MVELRIYSLLYFDNNLAGVRFTPNGVYFCDVDIAKLRDIPPQLFEGNTRHNLISRGSSLMTEEEIGGGIEVEDLSDNVGFVRKVRDLLLSGSVKPFSHPWKNNPYLAPIPVQKPQVQVILLGVEESAVEYNSDCIYIVKVIFNDQASLRRAQDYFGPSKISSSATQKLRLTGNQYYIFTDQTKAKKYVGREVFYNYRNHYSGSRFEVKLTGPKFEYSGDHSTGSSADGEDFSEWVSYLRESYTYDPSL